MPFDHPCNGSDYPKLDIISPTNNSTFEANQSIPLRAKVDFGCNNDVLRERYVKWISNKVQKELANSFESEVSNLPSGRHEISIKVNFKGEEIIANTVITIAGNNIVDVPQINSTENKNIKPNEAPVAAIIEPYNGQIIKIKDKKSKILIKGVAYDSDNSQLGGGYIKWAITDMTGINIAKDYIGEIIEPEIILPTCQNEYTLIMTVTDTDGLTSSAKSKFIVQRC